MKVKIIVLLLLCSSGILFAQALQIAEEQNQASAAIGALQEEVSSAPTAPSTKLKDDSDPAENQNAEATRSIDSSPETPSSEAPLFTSQQKAEIDEMLRRAIQAEREATNSSEVPAEPSAAIKTKEVSSSEILLSPLQERSRSIYLHFGLGAGSTNHQERESHFRAAAQSDFLFGYAARENLYIVLAAAQVNSTKGDQFYSTRMHGIGVRHYPLTKGVQWGGDLGYTIYRITEGRFGEQLISRSFGAAMRLSLLYDFDSSMVGPAFFIGSTLLLSAIEGEGMIGGGFQIGILLK